MKGKVFADREHLISYPVIAEVKYDEIRCQVHRVPGCGVHFISYAGNELCNMGAWEQVFYVFMRDHGITDLDIGIEVNGNFNDSYRWVRSSSGVPTAKLDKKTGKTAPELKENMVRFILFDTPDDTVQDYSTRRHNVWKIVNKLKSFNVPISTPLSFVCDNSFEVMTYFKKMCEEGYEGLMVKTPQHLYQPGKRIDGWLKLKPNDTIDGEITGINQAFSEAGEPLGRAGSINLRMPDGSSASPHGIPHELGRTMWENPQDYIYQWAEFAYMERDRQGGYRHPVFKRLREAK